MVSMKKLIVLFLIPIFLLCELNAQEGSSSKTDTETLLIDPTERDMEFKKNNNQLSGDEWEEYKRIDRSKKKSEFKTPSFFSDFFSKKTEDTTFRNSNINNSDKKVLDCMFSFDDNEYEKKLNEEAFLEAKREYCKYDGFSSYDNCDEDLNQKLSRNPRFDNSRFDNFDQTQECQIYLTIKKECEVEVAKESVFQGGPESTPSDYRKMNHRNSISHCIKTNAISYFNE